MGAGPTIRPRTVIGSGTLGLPISVDLAHGHSLLGTRRSTAAPLRFPSKNDPLETSSTPTPTNFPCDSISRLVEPEHDAPRSQMRSRFENHKLTMISLPWPRIPKLPTGKWKSNRKPPDTTPVCHFTWSQGRAFATMVIRHCTPLTPPCPCRPCSDDNNVPVISLIYFSLSCQLGLKGAVPIELLRCGARRRSPPQLTHNFGLRVVFEFLVQSKSKLRST